MWRPEGWYNPYTSLSNTNKSFQAFEEGAESIIQYLIRDGKYFDAKAPTFNTLITDGKTKGWMVWLPDENR